MLLSSVLMTLRLRSFSIPSFITLQAYAVLDPSGTANVIIWRPMWHSLKCKNGAPAELINLSRKQLRNNPHIAAYHFHRRFLAMMECIIKPKFGVTDWWNRYEFKQRASSHNHGVM